MAFDAAMLSSVIYEINSIGGGGRIEKIYQPEKEEIIIQMRTQSGGKKLLINCSSSNPRISFSESQRENPQNPPMFCMLLRKHLNGATLNSITQLEFERAALLEFNTRDEMGFDCKKYLIAEIMGKYSNLIFANEDMKIISAIKIIDYSTSMQRQILSGIKYTLPPKQDKLDPRTTTIEEFTRLYDECDKYSIAEKFITSNYLGIAQTTAREAVFRATGRLAVPLYECDVNRLYDSFCEVLSPIFEHNFFPSIIYDNGMPIEYGYTHLTQYGKEYEVKEFPTLSAMLDTFFESKDKETRVRQRASDILKLLTRTEGRILKKLELQKNELLECNKADDLKKKGDLITSNMYAIKKGDKLIELTDYESYNEETGEFGKIVVELDERLSPSANAQKIYKKYNKLKNAKCELSKQIEIGENELKYIYTVFDALTKAEGPSDLQEIREELYRSGYASKMKGYSAPKKQPAPVCAKFKTRNGYTVYCGKNNMQNEYITHKLAEKNDYWFHAKNVPGSHVLLVTHGEEPPAEDFTDAAEIAAYYSKAYGGASIEVDYMLAKAVKKISGAKMGMVMYHSNWSCNVSPSEQRIKEMRIK